MEDGMPYIEEERRKHLDPLIAQLARALTSKGECNYAITRIICGLLQPDSGYGHLSSARAILMDVYDEFTRKVMEPYEDAKEMENGPVHQLGKELGDDASGT
jgi:hypothetical protein